MDSGAEKWRKINFEGFWTGPGTESRWYFDDIYIQIGTRARVEICGDSSWSARKHCEIQIPAAWTDNSITYSVNQGSFRNGETAYLYVVDSNGSVNANGYPVTITGGTSSCSPTDANQDGTVSISELMAYIDSWQTGAVNLPNLMEAIAEWKNGC